MPKTEIRHCLICDTEWEARLDAKREHITCQDCRRTERSIDYGLGKPCIPWMGEFDGNDNPMKFGELYLPGDRTCKHRDCVEQSHIILDASRRQVKQKIKVRAKPLGTSDRIELLALKMRQNAIMSGRRGKLQKTH